MMGKTFIYKFYLIKSEESPTGLTKPKILHIVTYIRFLFSYEKIYRFVLKEGYVNDVLRMRSDHSHSNTL